MLSLISDFAVVVAVMVWHNQQYWKSNELDQKGLRYGQNTIGGAYKNAWFKIAHPLYQNGYKLKMKILNWWRCA